MRLTSVLAAASLLGAAACGGGSGSPHPGTAENGPVRKADAENGRLLLRQYGCGSCHVIPGVADARGNVGPPLAGVARRVYLAGMLPNTPDNMALWISAPKRVDPLTTMPDLGVPEPHVRDIVAYLYGLR